MFNKKKVEAVVNKTTYKPCTKKTRHVEVGIKCFTIRASVFSNKQLRITPNLGGGGYHSTVIKQYFVNNIFYLGKDRLRQGS